MTLRDGDHEEITQYLLGNLSEESQKRVETRLLAEESFFEELLMVEEELIDDYLSDALPGSDPLKFEQQFLCTAERQQKLRFAQSLRRYTSDLPEATESDTAQLRPVAGPTWGLRLSALWSSRPLALRTAAAFVLVAILAGVLWLYLTRTRPAQTFATLTLTASVSNRADAVQAGRVKLLPDHDALRVYLTLPEPSPTTARYRAELDNLDNVDREIKPLEITGQDARSVSVVIPATQLGRGQYALRLLTTSADNAERRIGSYFFNVE
jgi:hypothetical protein